jgi:hypothetical protein
MPVLNCWTPECVKKAYKRDFRIMGGTLSFNLLGSLGANFYIHLGSTNYNNFENDKTKFTIFKKDSSDVDYQKALAKLKDRFTTDESCDYKAIRYFDNHGESSFLFHYSCLNYNNCVVSGVYKTSNQYKSIFERYFKKSPNSTSFPNFQTHTCGSSSSTGFNSYTPVIFADFNNQLGNVGLVIQYVSSSSLSIRNEPPFYYGDVSLFVKYYVISLAPLEKEITSCCLTECLGITK